MLNKIFKNTNFSSVIRKINNSNHLLKSLKLTPTMLKHNKHYFSITTKPESQEPIEQDSEQEQQAKIQINCNYKNF
jgi:hypothetical protein